MNLLYQIVFSIIIIFLPLSLAYSKITSFEVSFGHSIMFVDESDRNDIKDKNKVVLPTSSSLMIIDLIYNNKFSFPLFYNLPLTSQKFIVDDIETIEKASPVFGGGMNYTFYWWDIKDNLAANFSVASLLGIAVDELDSYKFFPMIAIEASLLKTDGFMMYLGVERTVGMDVTALFYGVGQRF